MPLADWPRQFYTPTDGAPLLYYAVFGTFPAALPDFPAVEYGSAGIPAEMQIAYCSAHEQAEMVSSFTEGYAWDAFAESEPDLAAAVRDGCDCIIVRCELTDQPDLNYLRDVVGLVTFLLDQGGLAVNDAQILAWYSVAEWRKGVFSAGAEGREARTVILASQQPDGATWLHTRGLRKFGRPDISIRNVPEARLEAAATLCDRFTDYLVHGGVIAEGQLARLRNPDISGICYLAGHLEDPEFNNTHVEIVLSA